MVPFHFYNKFPVVGKLKVNSSRRSLVLRGSVLSMKEKMSSVRNVEMTLEKAVSEYCLPSFSKLKLTIMSKYQFLTSINLLQWWHFALWEPGVATIFFLQSLLLHVQNGLTATFKMSGQQIQVCTSCCTALLISYFSVADTVVDWVVKHFP